MAKVRSDLLPPTEPERLAAVRRYDILDTPPDGAFDRVTALAARICEVPISTITIVDEDRIWFKSAVGLEGVTQIDRDPGLCASAIIQQMPYLVTDAKIDPRTLDNPLVCGELGLRFYAAVPLRTADGHNLGTLNVIDRHPRELSDGQLASLEDLASLVMDELELRLAAKRTVELESLRAAAEFRDSIVAGMSHEMRTPIAVLQGLVDLVEGGDDDQSTGELRQVFRRQVRHLDRLVERFLDYASLEHQQPLPVELAPTAVAPLLQEAVDLHRDQGTIELELPEELPPARVDPARGLHVVSELIGNAVRFGPAGAPVTVRASVDEEADTLRISVEDRGPGIAEEALPHLFERYFRTPTSTGSGLGLFVARELAEAQNGRIEVASTPGAGSRFTFVVPVAQDGQ